MISDEIIVFDNEIVLFLCLLLLNTQVCMTKYQLCYKYRLYLILVAFLFCVSLHYA